MIQLCFHAIQVSGVSKSRGGNEMSQPLSRGNDHVHTPPAGEQNITILYCLLYKYFNIYSTFKNGLI